MVVSLHEGPELGVGKTLADVEGQGHDLEDVLAGESAVLPHHIEHRLLITQ